MKIINGNINENHINQIQKTVQNVKDDDETFFSSLIDNAKLASSPEHILMQSIKNYQSNNVSIDKTNRSFKEGNLTPDAVIEIQKNAGNITKTTEITTKIMSLVSTGINKLLSVQ